MTQPSQALDTDFVRATGKSKPPSQAAEAASLSATERPAGLSLALLSSQGN